MSTILGNPITLGGGGAKLNIDFGTTPPSDTSKLWVPLEKKPDSVECSPVLNYGSEYITTLSNIIVPTKQSYGAATIKYGDYLYICGGRTNYSTTASGDTNAITKINIKTGEVITLSAVLSAPNSSMFYAVVNEKLWMIGGLRAGASYSAVETIQVFDPATETVTKKSGLSARVKRSGQNNLSNSCFAYGKYIYIMGFEDNAGTKYSNVDIYDTETGTERIAKFQAQLLAASYSQPIAGKVYSYSGIQTNGAANGNIYEYNLLNETVVLKQTNNNYIRSGSNAFTVGKYVYIFYGYNALGNVVNTIDRHDTDTGTITTLPVIQPYQDQHKMAFYDNFSIYLMGGRGLNSSIPFRFTAETNLTKNHLFLQEDYGYDFLWSAIKSKDVDLKVKVINAYIGDSNNIAQPTNAYLYDTNTNQWKSLSGESYVADMLNALNVLGVN